MLAKYLAKCGAFMLAKYFARSWGFLLLAE